MFTLERIRPVLKQVTRYGQALGLDMVQADYEDPGQIELNFAFGPALATSDRLVTYRQICIQVAQEFGMLATFMNTASVLSIGVFFTLMIVGLATGLPHALQTGLAAHGVSGADATRISHLPPVATLFAAFLGYNPIKTLLDQAGATGDVPPHDLATLTGHSFFPQLISQPFHDGLVIVFLAPGSTPGPTTSRGTRTSVSKGVPLPTLSPICPRWKPLSEVSTT